jgi:hypothetical protein
VGVFGLSVTCAMAVSGACRVWERQAVQW